MYKVKRFSQYFQEVSSDDSEQIEQIGPIIKGVGKFVMKSMKKSKGKSKNMGRKQPPGKQSTDLTKAQKRDQELIKQGKLDPESVTEMDGATANDISAAIQAENSKKPKIIPPKDVKTKPKNYGVKYSDTNDYYLTSFSGYKVKRFSIIKKITSLIPRSLGKINASKITRNLAPKEIKYVPPMKPIINERATIELGQAMHNLSHPRSVFKGFQKSSSVGGPSKLWKSMARDVSNKAQLNDEGVQLADTMIGHSRTLNMRDWTNLAHASRINNANETLMQNMSKRGLFR